MPVLMIVAAVVMVCLLVVPIVIRYRVLRRPLTTQQATLVSLLIGLVALAANMLAISASGSPIRFGDVKLSIPIVVMSFLVLRVPFLGGAQKERINEEELARQRNASGFRAP